MERNADFLIVVNVKLQFYSSTEETGVVRDVRGRDVEVLRWNNCQQDGFKANFEYNVRRAWENKLWLVPSGWWGCSVLERGSTHVSYVPNLKCGLIAKCVESDSHHLEATVYRVAEDTFFTSSMGLSGWLDSNDVIPSGEFDREIRGGEQPVLAHEIGHWIGLSHVAHFDSLEICAEDPNDRTCYGGTDWQRCDIMGRGNRVEPWHAAPWLRCIDRHLDSRWIEGMRWEVSNSHVVPRAIAVLPASSRGQSARRLPGGVGPVDGGVGR